MSNNPLNIHRNERDLPPCIVQWGWRYHHLGVPILQKLEGMRYIPHLKFHVKGFDTNPFGVEWMYFDEDCPMHPLIKTVPHLAFVVDDLEQQIKEHNLEVLNAANYPSDGIKVAMIAFDGAPLEIMEFDKKA